jgi:hypothetical protein
MDNVIQKDVVPILAKIVHPLIHFREARNRIREVISRATTRGELKRLQTAKIEFNHDLFWRWARKKWPELQDNNEIPVVSKAPSTGSVSAKVPSFTSSASGYTLPADPKSDRSELIKANQTINKERAERALLEKEITPLRELKKKDDARREKNSIAGKNGGRGNIK